MKTEKKIEDYLHLYLGCECQTPEGVMKLNAVYHDSNPVFYDSVNDFAFSEIKLILRPLSSMTEVEQNEIGLYGGGGNKFCDWKGTPVNGFSPDTFRLLLSKSFDLFGLIESGLAIDATTLKQTS